MWDCKLEQMDEDWWRMLRQTLEKVTNYKTCIDPAQSVLMNWLKMKISVNFWVCWCHTECGARPEIASWASLGGITRGTSTISPGSTTPTTRVSCPWSWQEPLSSTRSELAFPKTFIQIYVLLHFYSRVLLCVSCPSTMPICTPTSCPRLSGTWWTST